ncbi:presqualene diphosphate phosphatase-like protein [Dinothrombium tinctorium]|uniref:Presqualene diphosphate phosphatase-like protein n=1 Tax=Dinothrombium tinctorium TaxID=1965070 RepID=A0A3S3PVP3_9ACAR|nr:presqualene diphosphate phosphatase-like protein [Dinothrombium tinctorium]
MSAALKDTFREIDSKISYSVFKAYPKSSDCQLLLKSLEWSCHGVPFLSLTLAALYLWPQNETVAKLLLGLIADIIYVALIKAFSRRRRPIYAKQDDQITIAMDKHSFPSGHASRAIYVALFFNDQSFMSLLIWIWALSVCMSRIFLGRHFITDVIGGILLGAFNHWFQFGIGQSLYKFFIWLLFNVLGVQFSTRQDYDSEDTLLDDDS